MNQPFTIVHMNQKNNLLLITLLAVLLSSCGSSKKVAYLQQSEHISEEEYATQTTPMYEARIMPKDILTITVSTSDPEAARPFNITVPISETGNMQRITTQTQLSTYLVDNQGQINFPVLGMITLKGKTVREAEKTIVDLLKPYIKEEPLVVVKFGNYKISVLGEVSRPGSFTVTQEKINVLEALAMAGDMTIYGVRDNVKIIREDANGNKRIMQLDLNNPYLVFTPDYYLQQNDVIYVEPNKVKAQNARIGAATSLWISGVSIAITVANLVINILK